jgi:putative N-acetylmannosamine-6-phosphate epimerase
MMEIPCGVIISCQAGKGMPFYNTTALKPLIHEILNARVAGLRLNGADKIRETRKLSEDVPIIGLAKKTIDGVIRITPYARYIREIWKSGCNWVAVEAVHQSLNRFPELKEIINEEKIPCIADISTLDEAIAAEQYGFVAITTALSGYRHCEFQAKPFDPPDIHLVEKCAERVHIPVIAEGRYHDRKDVKRAFNAGARAVCLGTAVTRPKLIAEFYKEWEQEVV